MWSFTQFCQTNLATAQISPMYVVAILILLRYLGQTSTLSRWIEYVFHIVHMALACGYTTIQKVHLTRIFSHNPNGLKASGFYYPPHSHYGSGKVRKNPDCSHVSLWTLKTVVPNNLSTPHGSYLWKWYVPNKSHELNSSHMTIIWHWRENEIKMNKQKTQIWLLTFSLALSEFM